VIAFTAIVFGSTGSLVFSSDWSAFATRPCSTWSAKVHEPSRAGPAVIGVGDPPFRFVGAELLKTRIDFLGGGSRCCAVTSGSQAREMMHAAEGGWRCARIGKDSSTIPGEALAPPARG